MRRPVVLAYPALAALAAAGAVTAEPPCPPAARIEQTLAALPMARGVRAGEEGADTPPALVRRAAAAPGTPAVEHAGRRGWGVVVAAQPVAALWRAVNDEAHHVGYLPVTRSRVVAGTPRGRERWLFQSFERFGIGRYWVDRVWMDGELYRASGGRMWRLAWEDDFAAAPADLDTGGLKAVEHTRGSWLLVPLGERCTLIDYYVHSHPGGWLAAFQGLALEGALADTLEGLLTLAREHFPAGSDAEEVTTAVHDGPPFLAPDGSVLP